MNPRPPSGIRFTVVAAFILTGAVFLPGVGGDFVFDDVFLIPESPVVQHPDAFRQILGLGSIPFQYRPVRTLSYAIEYRIWGAWAPGYHLTNMVLHAITGLLLYALAARLDLTPRARLLAMTLFLIHPVQVDSVTYISGRRDVLCGLFYLAGLHAFWRVRQGSTRWFVAVILAYLLGMFTKEMAVTLPGICWLIDRRGPGPDRVHPAVLGTLLLVGLAYSWFITHAAQGVPLRAEPYGGSRVLTLLTDFRILTFLLGLLLVPGTLSASYSFDAFPVTTTAADPEAWLSCVALVGLGGMVWQLRERFGPGLVGYGWFLMAMVPVSHIVLPHPELLAEHYLYIPAMGLYLAAGALLDRVLVPGSRRHRLLLAGILLGYGARSFARTFDWQDGLSLWGSAVEAYPRCVRARMNLALELEALGQADAARTHHEAALAIAPDDAMVLTNFGAFLVPEGRTEQALELLDQALALAPRYAPAHAARGAALRELGRYEEATRGLERAIELDPSKAATWNNLGLTRSRMGPGQIESARTAYRRALEIAPASVMVLHNLALLETAAGRPEQALVILDQALILEPDRAALQLARARVLAALSRLDEARSVLEGLLSGDGTLDRELETAVRALRASLGEPDGNPPPRVRAPGDPDD